MQTTPPERSMIAWRRRYFRGRASNPQQRPFTESPTKSCYCEPMIWLLQANDLGFGAEVLFVVSQTVLSRCLSSRSASFTQYSAILIKRSASWASGSSPAWRATWAAHLLISGASDIGIPQTRPPPVGLGGDPKGSRETLRTCYA